MFVRLRAVAVLVLALAAPMGAQSSAGGIRGQVTAADARPVEGMTVTAVRPDGSFLRRTVTDESGAFLVGALPAGEYEVSLRRVGFRPTVVRGVVVAAGRTTELAINVTATAVELAPIVVEAGGITIERGSPQFESTLNERAITRLPTGVDAQRLVALTPGVRADQLWGGSSTQANNYQLNGMSANHPGLGGALVSPNVSWIEQIEVRGLGAGAEHGNFQGGIVNVVTKTGSNTLQGHIRTALETHRLNGSNLTRTEDVPELASRNEVEGEVRGPLVRDRLFYYVSGQVIRSDRRAVNHLSIGQGRFAPDMERSDEVRALLRVTSNPTTSDLLNATAGLTGTFTDQFGLTGREVQAATLRRSAPMQFYDVSWERRLGRFGFLEAKGAHMRGRDERRPYAADSVPGIATYQVATSRRFQNAVYRELQRPTSTVGSLIWRGFATTGPVQHSLTAGAEDGMGTWRHQRARNGGMTWRPRYYPPVVSQRFDPADPRTWDPVIPTQWGGEVDIDTRVRNTALFLQDDLTWWRMTFTPGVRFGWWNGRMRDTAGHMMPAIRTRGLDPRLGVVLDLSRGSSAQGGAPSFVVKAHAGRYHQAMFSQLFDRVAGTAGYSDAELWEYTGGLFDDPLRRYTTEERNASGLFRPMERVELSQTGRVENFRQPYMDQLVTGLEKTFAGRVKFGALWIRRDNHNLAALVDRNVESNWTAYDDVAVMGATFMNTAQLYDHDGKPLRLSRLYIRNDAIIASLKEYVRLSRIDPTQGSAYAVPGFTAADTAWLTYNPDYVLTTGTAARRKYDQYQVNASAVLGWLTAGGSASFTNLRGNLFSVSGYDEATVSGRDRLEGRGPGPFVRPNEATNFWGKLENYSTLELKFMGTADLPADIVVGAYWYRASGDRLTPSLTTSRHAMRYITPHGELHGPVIRSIDGNRIFTKPRGGYKYKSRQTLDLRVARPFRVGAGDIEVAAEAFNVFGARDVTLVNTYLESQVDPNLEVRFFDPLRRVDPRRLRVTAALRY